MRVGSGPATLQTMMFTQLLLRIHHFLDRLKKSKVYLIYIYAQIFCVNVKGNVNVIIMSKNNLKSISTRFFLTVIVINHIEHLKDTKKNTFIIL